ncbi:chemotaxis response regulator protein-glutamate methylesterase [Desulfobacter postgatei]|jgi:two-component system chemotaxis response regulator CheB|uniref:protein-glutamate methylesterase/protein-glutamine glutaminase n=1 Tax=Desulfobacter postgatei TaxID=2293 RepID=UPI002A35ACDC|nr:chemotaxis response regulator protein-glutamate methylesterase [Desulfobacter postgatei]MDX9962549.1 chemotaxis response regulator protein-glutamate methylesterase [Desulfobacter postgatei]
MGKKIRVLVVDDSALVRSALSEVLTSDPEIEIMAMARDPIAAALKIRNEVPDVIILDVEMPRMNGITFLKKIMSQHPIPVIICSTLAVQGGQIALSALESGAVEVMEKPSLGTRIFFEESKIRICDTVKAAAMVKIKMSKHVKLIKVSPKLTADAILPGPSIKAMDKATETVIAVGASTGGTEALRVLFESLPRDSPGMVVVQHMPANFTKTFADRLDETCLVSVREAKNNDTVLRGQVLIAPGNYHMLLKRSATRYYVEIREGPLVSRHRPSVDVLFRSTARYAGRNAMGVIMTGMGDDGAKGMLEMKQAGAYNIAQDKASCVVFGMPREAIKLDAVHSILPLDKIADALLKKCRSL